ncbi:hypothetical protein F8388_005412 [Cannabis sativa]|uniref:RNase H type-1 domain-containing protein n=1 Tax=Cannabis sativa TaxID=3483 RepID=A0A7J6H8N8_CANSA|nr:hypothetical protein F8388_005412 [Cannabis sativa]KAF4400652.1 hypothetical protein G4B88_023060 [Cannabis sativa]
MLSFEKEEPSPEMLNMPATMDTTDTTMEDLLAKTTNLTVLDEDGWEINLAGRSEVESLCAMGRLCSNRPMNRPLLKTILGRIWGISEKDWGVEIKFSSKESSFLVFSFKSSQDLNRIITKNPWFLNNGFLIVERFNGIPNEWNKVLTRFPLSGRVLNLPPRSITQANLERLASFAGEIITKRINNSTATPYDNGNEIILGPPSVVTPGKLTNLGASSCPHFIISTFTHSDKCKEVISNTAVLDSKTHENMISQGTLSYEGRFIKEKLIESQSKTKRNGSWRDEIETFVSNSSTPVEIMHSSTDRESLIKSIFNSPINLVDVPIIYDNDDASVNKVDGPSKRRQPGYSLSAVIRDSEGSLVIAKFEFMLGCSSVLLAEGTAIFLGMKPAISRSLWQVQVASDSKTIINAIRMQNTNYADWGPLVQQIIQFRDYF